MLQNRQTTTPRAAQGAGKTRSGRIDDELWEAAGLIAAALGIRRSDLLRNALSREVRRQERLLARRESAR